MNKCTLKKARKAPFFQTDPEWFVYNTYTCKFYKTIIKKNIIIKLHGCFYLLSAKPGLVQFERKSISIREDIGVFEVPVVRIEGKDGSLLVKYKAVIGTAISLVDFSIADGELLFREGVDRLTIKVKIIDDRIKEPDETFTLLIYEPDSIQGRRIGEITSLVVTIIDNDSKFMKIRFPSLYGNFLAFLNIILHSI